MKPFNTATSSLNEIKTILGDFRGKQTELNALKASLETLKSSLENLNKSGLINDSQAGVAQTYSSNKINNLLQGVLRESDASEGNANGKLVRRNAQGNIYATNIYLNATTKTEFSDVKNSLAVDKWRFIVRDTNEGLLRSMSIKDFINSQEVDAYTKAQSDAKYLTEAKGDTRYLKTAYANQPNGYPQLDASKKIAAAQLPTEINATTLDGLTSDGFVRASNFSAMMGQVNENIANLSLTKVNKADIFDNASHSIKKEWLPRGLVIKDMQDLIPIEAIPIKERLVELNGDTIDLRRSKNFILTFTSGTFNMGYIDDGIGHSGIIVVKGAKKITGWGRSILWREVPTDLKDTEVFAYFVATRSEVYMGRA